MGTPKYGVHKQLEDAANELIKQSLVGVTSQTAKRDILTPWKEKDRREREVYTESGVPDVSARRGMYHRARNETSPHLNSRDGTAMRGRRTPSSLQSFVAEHGTGFIEGESSRD